MASKNDNRMGWIRMLEELETETDDKYRHAQEYEILSECRIAGLLDYENSKILCGGYAIEKSKDGLYSYLLKIIHPGSSNYNKEADKAGYHVKGGVVGELMVLFSLFFRCRFYLSSTMYGELNSKGLRIKIPHEYTRIQHNPAIHPPIFSSESRNFAKGLAGFLDKAKSLPAEFHQQFILAGYHYLRALREVGIDTEMVFIRLVSAVEALSSHFIELDSKEDPLENEDVKKLINGLKYSEEQKKAIRQTFDTRKSGKKFAKFIETYSTGYIKGGNYKAKHTRIKKKDLPKTAKAIYSARSSYLHNGEPMYLSMLMHGNFRWDTDPSLGMIIDNRSFPASKKLPYAFWFEGLVRHCIMKFLKEKRQKT